MNLKILFCGNNTHKKIERKENIDEIIDNLNKLLDFHISVRSYTPYIGEELLGSEIIPAKGFYELHGYRIEIKLDSKIDDIKRTYFNDRSHWLNQNVIIRLCALLEKHQFIGNKESKIKINHNSIGSKEVVFVRKLRNIFGHSSGLYNPKNRKHKKLRNELISYFKIQNPNEDFPLSINDVIKPLFQGCETYIRANY